MSNPELADASQNDALVANSDDSPDELDGPQPEQVAISEDDVMYEGDA